MAADLTSQFIAKRLSEMLLDSSGRGHGPSGSEHGLDSVLTELSNQLEPLINGTGDGDRILANLARFLTAARAPQTWISLFLRDEEALSVLCKLFATSQYMAEILIQDPEAFDCLRAVAGQPLDRQLLQEELNRAMGSVTDLTSAMKLLRDFRHREMLRIAYCDFIHNQPIELVTEQISELTEIIIDAALTFARMELAERRQRPRIPGDRDLAVSILALGKLGGMELNYSSDVDLIFISEDLDALNISSKDRERARDYLQRLGQLVIRILSESTEQGIAYRVDMRLRPHGNQGPLVVGYRDALNYYDMSGRTWERQVFVKARAIGGDIELGSSLLEQLQPWIYRRYLMNADITGIAALKRRIERRSREAGDDDRNVKLGHGGIRDVEYVIQFLQLLNGSDSPQVRCTGTLAAIEKLHEAMCLTAEEQTKLADNYRFLRRIEHFLQIMFDQQTHALPADPHEFRNVALRMGYQDEKSLTAQDAFREELTQRTSLNRHILDHLLHNAFADTPASAETDLVLDPEPQEAVIREVLEPHRFADPLAAYRHLQAMAVESIRFLSTRRSRHFLAAISPKLLSEIAITPDADATLVSLANVSDSLGGKAVLWELFSATPASMELCVRLCACSPYLASILTSNPGMLDELLDCLMLGKHQDHSFSREALAKNLDQLCHNAVDTAPILNSFKNSGHLRVGVLEILGKSSITDTHGALSDIADVCMEQVIQHEFHRLIHQLGMPVLAKPDADRPADGTMANDQPAEFVVLAVGKLGGREPNYHSDLDVIFLYDGEGSTRSLVPNRRFEPTTNRHFFNQLGQRVIQAVTRIGNVGRLFDIDVRLRPLGRSGPLAISIQDLQNYFEQGRGQLWERQSLCKARPIWGSRETQAKAMNAIEGILSNLEWSRDSVREIYDHRMRLQQGVSPQNLKRGEGGTMDVEFTVQMLQLSVAAKLPQTLESNTLLALEKLAAAGVLEETVAQRLAYCYRFLRRVESAIRLMNMSARHDLPTDESELTRLAYLLNGAQVGPSNQTQDGFKLEFARDGKLLAQQCVDVQKECRQIFLERFHQAGLPNK